MDMQNVVYTCNRVSFSLKQRKILTHAVTHMYLEGILIREISQSQKDKYHVVPLTKAIGSDRLIEKEVKMMAGPGKGKWRAAFKRSSVSIWEDARFWRWVMVMIAQQGERASCS